MVRFVKTEGPDWGFERPGDVSIEERVNSGESQLFRFGPTHSGERDAHRAITSGSPMRSWIYLGVEKTHPQKSSRRDDIPDYLLEKTGPPNYVISTPIKIGDQKWDYRTPTKGSNIRRVFTEQDQIITLDVETTLQWLNARGGPKRSQFEPLLREEADYDNVNNQLLMQLMHERIEEGKPMLPRSNGVPYKTGGK